MASLTYYIALLFAALVISKVVSYFLAFSKFKKFAEQNGCGSPQDITLPSFPPGVERLRRMLKMKETGEDLLDDIIVPDFKDRSTVQLRVFDGNTLLSTAEPANIQALLATQFKDFGTGSRRYNCFAPVLGYSIFTSDGPFWEHSRALFRPQFARENINDLDMTDRAAGDLIDAVGSVDSNGWTAATEMMPLLYNFTLDTATDFLFGESIDSQRAATADRRGQTITSDTDPVRAKKLEDAKKFSGCFGIINDYLIKRIRFQSLYWLGDSVEFRKAVKIVWNFTDHFVRLASEPSAVAKRNVSKKNSLLNNLATLTGDPTELRSQTLAILVAGRDTTAALLGWCFVRLALHPEIFSKLRAIILRDFQPGEQVTFEKLKSCRYLQHFLNEVLRLHPTVPMNQRTAVKDTTLPTGGGSDGLSPIAVRKGQVVLFSVYVMQRRKDLWGSDALEFRPERWEGRFPAWQFLPFLGGPRICLGQQFALTEASFLLCRVLQHFDAIEPADGITTAKMRKGLGITMWPRDGANVRFHKSMSEK